MSEKKTRNKEKEIDITVDIAEFEAKVVNPFVELIKEKLAFLDTKKVEYNERKIVLSELTDEEILNDIQTDKAQKATKQVEEVDETIEEKVEVTAEDKPTEEDPKEDYSAEDTEKIVAVQSKEKVIPFIKDIESASAVRKVEPIREKPTVTKDTPTDDKPAFKKKTQDRTRVRDDRRNLNKKAKIKKGYEQSSFSVLYDESGEIRKIRTRKSASTEKKKVVTAPIVIEHAVINTENITVKQLSEKIGHSAGEIMKKLLDLGILVTINDTIDFDTAELVALELGVTLEKQLSKTSEEQLYELFADDTVDTEANLEERPPIVTIMGHVDHGKTSLLDFTRKSSVAVGEAGGITQHIGAYTIKLKEKQITFIDTPGHEAFTAMRARGADITDIVIIVVAADDGVMPQTVEAINHAKAANASIIVAINKMDKQQANPDRVLQQLADHNLLVEKWGGDVPAVKVSALTGEGVQELLETILTVAEMLELKANPNRTASGTIIESELDRGRGPVATMLVQTGTLKLSDFVVAGTTIGKIRAMIDDKGKRVNKATPSQAVSILGLQSVPNAGEQIFVVDERLSKKVVEERKNKEKIDRLKIKKVTLEDVFNQIEEGKFIDLNLIIKADVQGSIEALKQSLLKLSNEEVRVSIVHSGVGAINESDIMLADTSSSIIIGFNIRPDINARNLAEKNNVEIKLYQVIYEAIDDIEKAIKGLLKPVFTEKYIGTAEVRAVYKISGVGTIAGCMVKDGKIVRNAKVRLIRDSKEIFKSDISSLKRFKDDVREVASGYECGIGIEKFNDIKENDIIEAFMLEEEDK